MQGRLHWIKPDDVDDDDDDDEDIDIDDDDNDDDDYDDDDNDEDGKLVSWSVDPCKADAASLDQTR